LTGAGRFGSAAAGGDCPPLSDLPRASRINFSSRATRSSASSRSSVIGELNYARLGNEFQPAIHMAVKLLIRVRFKSKCPVLRRSEGLNSAVIDARVPVGKRIALVVVAGFVLPFLPPALPLATRRHKRSARC